MILTEGGQPTSIGSIRNLMANLPLYYILRHHRRGGLLAAFLCDVDWLASGFLVSSFK